ncbi:tripartite tricarboxylate transporter TctB family protein [Arenibaculum sp.]|jgi:putative Mn2+ efflux pump MntP|uniref:tripartite tricarboxylate transporter TctB family protein n=1 Tax=Arenibaculum sp. TaxID=2865862 RepID=UPI002E0DB2A7|nr:tripartite tricarboxylate transporter TctB family protein [Arenibaculum sp.]
MRNDWTVRDVGTVVAGLIFILLGAWMIRESFAMSPLGSVFPRTIAAVMIVCSVMLVVQRLYRRPAPPADENPAGESTGRRLALVAVMAAWVFLLPVLGFFTSSLLAFLVLLAVANYDGWNLRRVLVYGASAVGIIVAFYLVFVELLLLPMPRGFLI